MATELISSLASWDTVLVANWTRSELTSSKCEWARIWTIYNVDETTHHVRHSAANVICVMKMLSHLIQLCNDRKHCWVALILHLFSISIQSWTFNSFICKTMAFIKVLRYFPCTPEETSYIGCLSVELEQTWYTYPWFYLIQDLA